MVQEPVDRPLAGPGEAILHLADLLSDVDVDGRVAGEQRDPVELVGGRGAKAVRRGAEIGVRQDGDNLASPLDQAAIGVDIVQKSSLGAAPPKPPWA
jgi:hypothetical protein